MVVGRPFQPGQSGNPSGRPKTRPFKDALQKAAKGDANARVQAPPNLVDMADCRALLDAGALVTLFSADR